MSRKAAKFYSKGAEEFDKNFDIENIDQDYKRQVEEFSSKVESGKILDAGCGAGRDTAFLTTRGFRVVGVDLSEKMLELAREKQGEYRKMDLRDLRFDENQFDGVLSNQSLIFLPKDDMKEAIKEISRVLKPKGYQFLGLKKGEGTYKREKYGSEITQYQLTEKEAEDLLTEFEILEKNITERENLPDFMNILARKK